MLTAEPKSCDLLAPRHRHLNAPSLSTFVPLQNFKGGRFCSVTRSQGQLVLLHYEISMTVSLVTIRDFNDVRLYSIIRFQMMVGFIQLLDLSDGQFCLVTRSQ